MKLTVKQLEQYSVHATDKELGKIKDVYFDGLSFQIRYFVVDTKRWLPGKKVLLSPESVKAIDLERQIIELHLTKSQVEASPSLDEHRPVSRQHESDLSRYYGWTPYWEMTTAMAIPFPTIGFGGLAGGSAADCEVRSSSDHRFESDDPNLRAASEIFSYDVHGSDERLGVVDDAIVSTSHWTLPYLVIQTGSWLHDHKMILSSSFVRLIEWEDEAIYLTAPHAVLGDAPLFDLASLEAACDQALFQYFEIRYQRPPDDEELAQGRRGQIDRPFLSPPPLTKDSDPLVS